MSKQEKKGLMPELRFPEFLDKGKWECKRFDKVYSFKVTNSLSRDKLNYQQGVVKNIHYGDIHTKFSTLFDIQKEIVPYINSNESLKKIRPESYCIEGDIIFADASEDVDDVGKSIEIVSLHDEKLLSGLHTLLARQKKKKLITGFGGYLFKSNAIRQQIKRESQGAKVLGISAGRLSSINVTYPINKKEQQKIADCLSSLDQLIAAHTKKHEALQRYKKGLLQNLFPAEGETVPKLRFPEFRGTGEWIEKILKNVVDYENGKAHEQDIDEAGTFVVVNSKFISSEGEVKKFSNTANLLAKKGDILMVLSDVPNGRAIAKCFFVDKDNTYTVNQRICKLTANINNVSKMLFYVFNRNSYFLAFDDGVKQTNLKKNDVLNCPIRLPKYKKEQQKIADCLSSIDKLTTSQSQKIKALKDHKKALMQRLFPSMDEVSV